MFMPEPRSNQHVKNNLKSNLSTQLESWPKIVFLIYFYVTFFFENKNNRNIMIRLGIRCLHIKNNNVLTK